MDNVREHKEQLYITFHSEEDIIRFVDTCNQYDDAIDVIVEKITTDAKSIMGMLLMKKGEPISIDYGCYDDEDNYQEFRADIMEHFDVKAVPVKYDEEQEGQL